MEDIIILGAGIAGLGAAFAAKKNNATVFEKNDYIGGNCSSFYIDGFTFDNAIHLSFTKNKFVRSIFDKTPFYKHKPVPYNYYNGLWIKHPVQSNLYPLPVDLKVKAVHDFIKKPVVKNINNYEEWLVSQYGKFITEEFHNVYTKKYWRKHPSEMTTDWIGNRMKRVDLKEVLRGSMTTNTGHGYYTKEMRYPEKGGYISFLKPLGKEVNIQLKKEVVHIDTNLKKMFFADGSSIKYKHIFSSIPLPRLINLLDAPNKVETAAKKLSYTSVAIVSVGFNVPNITEHLWFYVYDEDVLASRIYSPSNKSPNNAPENCSSLQLEYYFNETEEEIEFDKIKENSLYALRKLGFPINKITLMDIRKMKYGNVIYTHEIISARKIVIDYLNNEGINTIGRYGEWKYLWSDQSFLSGYNKVIQFLKNSVTR